MILVSITMRYGTLTQCHARRFRNETEVTLEWYVGRNYSFIHLYSRLKVRADAAAASRDPGWNVARSINVVWAE
jgi:hypothetical protein